MGTLFLWSYEHPDHADVSFFLRLAVNGQPRKLDISYPSNEFTKLVKMWDGFDSDSMGVIVRHIKAYVLSSSSHLQRLSFFLSLFVLGGFSHSSPVLFRRRPILLSFINSAGLPSYVFEGRVPEPATTTKGTKRPKTKVRPSAIPSTLPSRGEPD